jgi:hypothetical protein
MKNTKYLLLIILTVFFIQGYKSQINTFYFNGEKVDSIDKEKNWYLINTRSEIKKCIPEIVFIENELSGFTGNIIENNEPNFLIFSSNKKLDLEKSSNKIDSIIWVTDKSKIQLNNHHFLIGRSKQIGNDKIFSLFIEDLKNESEYEISRNCTSIDKQNSYFGSGRVPFQIEFIGDIVNDNNPEIILSADKEASALKLVIGFEVGKYQILKWTEFE